MKKTLILLGLLMTFPLNASAGFGLLTGASWGIGKISSSAGTIESRTINNFSIHAMPGFAITGTGFMFGPFGEYRLIGQNTDVATVSNTNVKGTGYLIGIGGTFTPLDLFYVGASFDFLGKYNLSLNNTAGQAVGYKKPIGFHFLAGYMFMPVLSADVIFNMEQYKSTTIGGTDTDITSDKFKEWDIRVGASYHL